MVREGVHARAHAGKTIAVLCLGLIVSLAGPARAQSAPPASSADLQKVITELNTAASKFTSAQADFSWDQFVAVVQESEIQTGTIYFERKKGATRMAAYLKQDNGKDAPKTVIYDGGEVNLYEPAHQTVDDRARGRQPRPVGKFSDPGLWRQRRRPGSELESESGSAPKIWMESR